MLSEERIAEIRRFFSESGNCILPRTAHNMALELLAELTRLRTREYRHPLPSDLDSLVWVDDRTYPLILRYNGEYHAETTAGKWSTPLNGRLICPVEPKPLASNEGE